MTSLQSRLEHFPFLHLPFELRQEVYRHLFWIYPSARCYISYSHGARVFEIISHPPPKETRMCDYKRDIRERCYNSTTCVHHAECNTFLAILSVSHAIFNEAMPLFYSETFFVTTFESDEAFRFILYIGDGRRKYIRHLSVSYSGVNVSRIWRLDTLVRYVRDLNTLEVVLLGSHAELDVLIPLRPDMFGITRRPAMADEYGELWFGLGVDQLVKLKFLETLRLVGNLEKIMTTFYMASEWLEGMEGNEWTDTVEMEDGMEISFLHLRTKIEHIVPRDAEDDALL